MSTRDKILRAADSMFGELGFEAASTRQIAERSGVNKALIHYHFRTKEELWGAVLDRYYERLGALLRGPLQADGDLRERLGRLLDGYVDFLAENRSFSNMVQREVAGGRHVERIRAHMAPLFELGSSLVEQAWPAARGASPLAAPQLMISFYGMVVTLFTYSPVLDGLLGRDPLGADSLEARKRHLHRMLDLTLAALQQEDRANHEEKI